MVRRYTKKGKSPSRTVREGNLKIGETVHWIDGMGFESVGKVVEGANNVMVAVKRRDDGRLLKVKNHNLY